jgi:choline dehydrogenase-like flavoprotein
VGIAIMTEDLPEEHNVVTLDPELTDSDGIPAPKINYTVSDNTAKMLEHGVARATEIMEAAGAKKVFSSNLRRNAGWHLLGTARMGKTQTSQWWTGGAGPTMSPTCSSSMAASSPPPPA